MIDRHNPSMTFNMLELGRITTSPAGRTRPAGRSEKTKIRLNLSPTRLSQGLAELGKIILFVIFNDIFLLLPCLKKEEKIIVFFSFSKGDSLIFNDIFLLFSSQKRKEKLIFFFSLSKGDSFIFNDIFLFFLSKRRRRKYILFLLL